MKLTLAAVLTAAFAALTPFATAQTNAGSAWNYQGRLMSGGVPVNGTADLEVTLWDADAGGMQIGSLIAANNVTVTDGQFEIALDFGDDAFQGDARWLEISVRSPAGGGAFTPLTPRQKVGPVPYALALRGLRTTPSEHGTWPRAWNVVGGHPGNTVAAGVGGATIGGGGDDPGGIGFETNKVNGQFGTVGGGKRNTAGGLWSTVGGGENNQATGTATMVAGGVGNRANLNSSAVGGGNSNMANGNYSTIAGGQFNTAGGECGSVAGGGTNNAGGDHSFVAGGQLNDALGQYSFAAGRRAKANHTGCFVWSSSNSDFASTTNHLFLIDAVGGVGINTNAPAGHALAVNGTAANTTGVWAVFSDERIKKNIAPLRDSLDRLTALEGVCFEYTPDAPFSSPGPRAGLIAQQVEAVFPEWVRENPDGMKLLEMTGFEAHAIEAMKTLRAENDDLRSRVDRLEAALDQLLQSQ